MPTFNYDDDYEIENPYVIDAGEYEVVIKEALASVSSKGDDMFKLELEVTRGPHAGFRLQDFIVFSTNPDAGKRKFALSRVKQVLDAVGLSGTGEVEIHASDFEGRKAIVSIDQETRTHDGKKYTNMKVAFQDGWRPVEEVIPQGADDTDVPF